MNEFQRHNGILSLLDEKHSISVASIVETFDVSPATARRDLTKLDQQGKLIKVRSGAEQIVKQNHPSGRHLIWITLLITMRKR